MSKSDITQLRKKRGGIKVRLTGTKRFVDTILKATPFCISNSDLNELKSRSQNLVGVLKDFNEIQAIIECKCDDDDLGKEYDERENFENDYFKVTSIINDLIEQCSTQKGTAITITDQNSGEAHSSGDMGGSSGHATQNETITGLKLPTIHLPKFSGLFTNWLEFKDVFVSLIHDNTSVSSIQKFHYLRASLEGTAAQVVKSFEFSAVNYESAWKLLCERYDNNNLLIHNHIKAIFNIPNVNKESSASFRQMVDELSKHLRSLETLQTKEETFETMIIYVLTNKLDLKSTKDWEEKKQGEVPSLVDFKDFLKNKADLLETLEARTAKGIDYNYQKQAKPIIKHHKTFTATISTCNYCKKEHSIYQCKDFLDMSVEDRLDQVRRLGLCFNCLRTKHTNKQCLSGPCRKCRSKHNTLLHIETKRQEAPVTTAPETFNASCQIQGSVLLATAQVIVLDKNQKPHKCRAMLDCGSQSHFITTKLCRQLGLDQLPTNISVVGLNHVSSKIRFECQATIKSRTSNFRTEISCFVIDTISEGQAHEVDVSLFQLPSNITLADPQFGQLAEIDILLGGALFWSILRDGKISLGKSRPLLQNTALGWVVAGSLQFPTSASKSECYFTKALDIQKQLQQFWEIEEYPTAIPSIEHSQCEQLFTKTTVRNEEGRFVVGIPFKQEPEVLGDSKQLAMKRFLSLEKRLLKNPQLRSSYNNFMTEYEQLGHMSSSASSEANVSCYLPHHGVLKEDSLTTKLRVVFDGSAPTDNGISLNDIQHTGPNLQQDLISILIRFRMHNYVFTADIAKMYRQIEVRKEDKALQKILWRADPSDDIREYELQTVTYGTRSAPFLAMRCIKQLANDNSEIYPQASEIIERDFYMDDVMSGAQTPEQAASLCEHLTTILNSAGFELRKWSSNDIRVLKKIDPNKHTFNLQQFAEEKCKTLGLQWSCNSDTLSYKINDTFHNHVTKRTILSEISQVFDPLGLLAPCIIRIKILLQKLWALKLNWDDDVPQPLRLQWLAMRKELAYLNNLSIKRHTLCMDPAEITLHGFCDSSQAAYGACIYTRSVSQQGVVEVHLICAKTKVAPLKTLSIPRLELCGALMLARLMNTVKESLPFQPTCYCWTDSQVVLAWLKVSSGTLQTFVANRVSEIQQLTCVEQWNYVNTKENSADILSRGIQAQQLDSQETWWSGPRWLRDPTCSINYSCDLSSVELPEVKKLTRTYVIQEEPDYSIFEKYSSFRKLTRIIAFCLRFVNNCKPTNTRKTGAVTSHELQLATKKLIKLAQQQIFSKEISLLSGASAQHYKGKLQGLHPFIDNEGILRVGGRLHGSQLGYETKHPAILTAKHILSTIIFQDMHIELLHSGPQMLLFTARERYWVIGGGNLAKKIVRSCVRCFKTRPTGITPLMGRLPAHRVTPAMPFTITGSDFAGPFLLREKLGRGLKKFKCYICVFVCMTTKAIHLEPVTDLTADSFIAVLKRFVARRGIPSHLYSDNGTTYVRASKDLAQLGNFLIESNDQLKDDAAQMGITWNFIPPLSPNFGGLWEAAVKSTKFHLKRILMNECLTFEQFLTLLVTIEGILNSRPLCPMSSNPNDYRSLTPAHFLIGRPVTSIPETNLETVKQNRLTLHQHIQQLKQAFWKRWSKEYLTHLQVRTKWTRNTAAIPEGSLVLLRDNNLPPSQWRLGRITEKHPGPDGITRVVTIRTSSGTFQRAISKVCPLPLEPEMVDQVCEN